MATRAARGDRDDAGSASRAGSQRHDRPGADANAPHRVISLTIDAISFIRASKTGLGF
jgi:hypothetical protein